MPADDDKDIVAYLDDRLSDKAFRRFEERLKNEPELLEQLARAASDEALMAQAVETHAAMSPIVDDSDRGGRHPRISSSVAHKHRRGIPMIWFVCGMAATFVLAFLFVSSRQSDGLGVVVSVVGDVRAWSGARQVELGPGDALRAGARVLTGVSGSVVIRTVDGSLLDVDAESIIKLQREADGISVQLPGSGSFDLSVAEQSSNQRFSVQMRYAEVTVLSTKLRIEEGQSRGRISVVEGVVACMHESGASLSASTGQTVLVTADGLRLLESKAGSTGMAQGLNAYHLISAKNSLGELLSVSPVGVEKVSGINMPEAFADVVGGVSLEGYLEVPETGMFDLFLEVDDVALVEIDGKNVLRARHYTGGAVRRSVSLEKGMHSLRILGYNRLEAGRLSLKWAMPGQAPKEIAPELLWSDPASRSPRPQIVVASSLGHYKEHVPGNLVDGDPTTYFWSDGFAAVGSQVAVYFPEALELQDVQVLTGLPDGSRDFLQNGILEVSLDGTSFQPLCKFENGKAEASLSHLPSIRAFRIIVKSAQPEWLAIRAFSIR